MLFQLPGLNAIYFKYKAQNADTIEKIDKLSKLSTLRMTVVFLMYLIPVIIGFIVMLQENLVAYFICVGIDFAILITNFYLDSKITKNIVNKNPWYPVH